MLGRHRPFSIQVLVNAAERKELQKAAERNAIPTISSYVRAVALLTARSEEKLLEPRLNRRLTPADA